MKRLIYAFVCLQTMFFTSGIFADEAADALPPRDQGMWQTVVMISLAMVLGYFIIWRPEQKRRKAAEQQRSALKKGDRVTAMGILGTIVRIQENTLILKMYDGSKIEMLKAAITDVVPGNEEDAKKADKDDKSSKRIEISEAD